MRAFSPSSAEHRKKPSPLPRNDAAADIRTVGAITIVPSLTSLLSLPDLLRCFISIICKQLFYYQEIRLKFYIKCFKSFTISFRIICVNL